MTHRIFLVWLCAGLAAWSPANGADLAPMYLPDAEIHDVARFYEKLTGTKVIVDGLSGKLSISSGPTTKARRIELIEEGIFAAGYSIIETQPGTIQIWDKGARISEQRLPVIAKAEDLPVNERVVTLVYRVRSRKPAEFAKILGLIFREGPSGIPNIAPDEKQKNLRLTARTTALRNMLKVIGELDPAPKK